MTELELKAKPHQRIVDILCQLGLPPDALWEEAEHRIKDRIVFARRNNLNDLAALWSNEKARLKIKMPHKCLDCLKKTNLSRKGTLRCNDCALEFRRGKAKTADYKPNKSQFNITKLSETFVKSVNRPFFKQEISYYIGQRIPEASQDKITKVAGAALRSMKKHKMITGGGVKNWFRYEVIKLF